MLLPVTLTIAAACALINLWLAVRLVRGRVKDKVLVGDGGVPGIVTGMRAHANFVEYAPFVLVLMALIEFARGPSAWLWALGAIFVVARIAHPLGMTSGTANPLRAAGALGTWLVTVLLAGWALAIVYQAQIATPLPQPAGDVIVPAG